MEQLFSYGVLAPPGVFILLSLAGALAALRWRRMGIALMLASSLALYAAATPAVSSSLLREVEEGLPDSVDLGDLGEAQAIVVLGGDVRRGDGVAIPDSLGPISLERAVAAAKAHRRLQLPVAVSGGRVGGARSTEAALLQQALDADFAVPVRWVEDRSRTTWENAVFSAALLRPAQVSTVVLVTQAWHLPRAIWSFDHAGLHALPWPMPRTAPHRDSATDFLPSVGSLQNSFFALHEMIGATYYRLRY